MTKIAVISDIHGNIDALRAVLAHIDEQGTDLIICLGDIVGYGAAPGDCLHIIQDREIQTVMGNHDEYVTLIMDPRVERLRPEIRQAVEWTQCQLSMDDLKWLSNLPMSMEADEFSICHASFIPSRWAYCMDENSFQENFKRQTHSLAFCGHSHSPLIGMEIPGQMPMLDYIRKTTLHEDRKIMVNVGSVGQPRDRNPKSCVVFYELETRQLWLDRVPYDVEAAQKRITEAGLPQKFADRLALGK